MRAILGCVLLLTLWQEPSSETKKPDENKAAAPAAQGGGEAAKGASPVKATPESLASGKKTYGVDCAMCHGKDGAGDGDLAADMKLSLKDLRDEGVLKDVSDKELFNIIDKGKGKMMGEEGRLKPEQVWNVVNYVRSLAKK